MSMRRKKGVTIILLCFVLGLLTLPMLGIFAWECIRAISAREQLRSASESASLAGAAKLAGSDILDPLTAHNEARDAAEQAFRANSINNYSLATAARAATEFDAPGKDAATIFVEFLNPNSTPPNQPVPYTDTNGRIVRVVGAWGHTPAFGQFVGLGGPYIMRAEGLGRVPQLDVVLCFDNSGSIDDQTPVTLIKRWKTASGDIRYSVARANSNAMTTGDYASGRVWDIVVPASPASLATGTSANGHHPINMEQWHGSNTLSWDKDMRGLPSTGVPTTKVGGLPYGSYAPAGQPGSAPYTSYPPPFSAAPGTGSTFTHVVVNIHPNPSDRSAFGGGAFPWTSPAGFYYPNIFAVLEASLGNLDSPAIYSAMNFATNPAIGGAGIGSAVAGYQNDYLENAKKLVLPLNDAKEAAATFYDIMNTNTEAHFGLTCFNDTASTAPGDTQAGNHWGGGYPANGVSGGAGQNYPQPGVSLSKTVSNYTQCRNAVQSGVANTSTNMYDALRVARLWLTNPANFRPGAKRAVVFFTDGQPTAPSGSGAGSGSHMMAVSEADLCKNEGIPVYTIGLAQNDYVVPGMCETLHAGGAGEIINYTNQAGSPASYTCTGNNGIAAHAGNGGKFFLVTNSANLRLVFENIARQLVQLVKLN